ncbi:MAG: hypothetical protein BJ554DRAFT_8440 [Olpidium bornovanus]|uniref:Uncharacterized protein n=1 Tax=Olpidium bornovanus TaxID=278681 RepID=A0A8H7ZUA7_9FUNG|nr:MAG: hypothetical protein BJ554DRAFT_8440 [Olpidium bornovanus]
MAELRRPDIPQRSCPLRGHTESPEEIVELLQKHLDIPESPTGSTELATRARHTPLGRQRRPESPGGVHERRCSPIPGFRGKRIAQRHPRERRAERS